MVLMGVYEEKLMDTPTKISKSSFCASKSIEIFKKMGVNNKNFTCMPKNKISSKNCGRKPKILENTPKLAWH